MKIFEYVSPEGEITHNPNLEDLCKLILSSEENYWCTGSGQGYLTWYEKEDIPLVYLSLTFNNKYGFWLQHGDKRILDYSHTSLGDGDFNHENAVEVYICGDPLLLPSAFFISSVQACLAVKEFGITGNKSEAVKWGVEGEEGWDYGDAEGFI
jgi:hypothetical protein